MSGSTEECCLEKHMSQSSEIMHMKFLQVDSKRILTAHQRQFYEHYFLFMTHSNCEKQQLLCLFHIWIDPVLLKSMITEYSHETYPGMDMLPKLVNLCWKSRTFLPLTCWKNVSITSWKQKEFEDGLEKSSSNCKDPWCLQRISSKKTIALN